MFREMRRAHQALKREECIRLLTEERRGVLSLLGDGGYPYGVPLNHYYCPEDGKIYFHGGKAGHRVDAAKACGKASYCVFGEGFRAPGDWALTFRSVIVFGRLELIEDRETVERISRLLSCKFTQDEDYISREVASFGAGTLLTALTIEHMSGKQVHEA